MHTKKFVKAGIFMLVLVILFIAALEWYWRSKGFTPTINDDKTLWAAERDEVYGPINESTVFIGSSRIKFDLDIPTWHQITGDKAVQLAIVGTAPQPVLNDLANDEKFKGRVVVDVTEGLFFSKRPNAGISATEAINYRKERTLSQKWSNEIGFLVESNFVFVEEGKFGLNESLRDLHVSNRPGVFLFPVFPKEFEHTRRNRQTFMTTMFEEDTALQAKQKNIWFQLIAGEKGPGISGDTLENVFKSVKASIDKIRSRGGTVVFVRTPSSGPFEAGEMRAFPREKYWDALLAYTNSPGIHYKDNPATASYDCPEWSHLSSKDAVHYTKEFARLLQDEVGWTFPKKVSAQ